MTDNERAEWIIATLAARDFEVAEFHAMQTEIAAKWKADRADLAAATLAVDYWKMEATTARADLAAEKEANDRLIRTAAFRDAEYLAAHGGSWGDCKYKSDLAAAKALIAELDTHEGAEGWSEGLRERINAFIARRIRK